MRNIELRKKYKEEENAKVEITEVSGRTFINYEYVFWLEDMLVKNLSLPVVSNNEVAVCDHSKHTFFRVVDKTRKCNNCGEIYEAK